MSNGLFSEEFNRRVAKRIAEGDALFANLDTNGCHCIPNILDCHCTGKERCVRWVAAGKGRLNEEQRECLIVEAVHDAEGSLDRSDLENLPDAELAKQALYAMADYVRSQI